MRDNLGGFKAHYLYDFLYLSSIFSAIVLVSCSWLLNYDSKCLHLLVGSF